MLYLHRTAVKIQLLTVLHFVQQAFNFNNALSSLLNFLCFLKLFEMQFNQICRQEIYSLICSRMQVERTNNKATSMSAIPVIPV